MGVCQSKDLCTQSLAKDEIRVPLQADEPSESDASTTNSDAALVPPKITFDEVPPGAIGPACVRERVPAGAQGPACELKDRPRERRSGASEAERPSERPSERQSEQSLPTASAASNAPSRDSSVKVHGSRRRESGSAASAGGKRPPRLVMAHELVSNTSVAPAVPQISDQLASESISTDYSPMPIQMGDTDTLPLVKFCRQHNVSARGLEWSLRGSYCITDPAKQDNPMVFVSDQFLALTGYSREECIGYNCRLLQGPKTEKNALDQIRHIVGNGAEGAVRLTNYKKSGESFDNVFYFVPLRDKKTKEIKFHLGGQCSIFIGLVESPRASQLDGNARSNLILTPAHGKQARANQAPVDFEGPLCTGSWRLSTLVDPLPRHTRSLFEGTQRQMHFRLSFKLEKPLPEGYQLFLGGELSGAVKLSWKTKGLGSILVKLLRMYEPTVSATFGDNVTKGHIFFPLASMADRMRTIPPGASEDAAPEKCTEAHVRAAEPGRTFILEDGSAMVDIERWRMTNVPAVGTMSLSVFWSDMPLYLRLFAATSSSSRKRVELGSLRLSPEEAD